MKRLAALLLVLPFLGACGGESSPEDQVRAAVEDYLDALRDGDGETFCDKAFPSTVLPARIADRLTFVPPADTGGSPAGWDKENPLCRAQWGRQDEPEGRVPEDVSVVDVKLLEPFAATEGITAVANARVRSDGRVETLPVVEFQDDWKVVFAVR